MKKLTITREAVSSEISHELGIYDLAEFVRPGHSDNDINDIQEINPKNLDLNYCDNVNEISIDELRELLNGAESNGATHVGIYHHEDHREYHIYGFNVHEQTKEEKAAIDKALRERKKKQKEDQIKQLETLAARLGVKIQITE